MDELLQGIVGEDCELMVTFRCKRLADDLYQFNVMLMVGGQLTTHFSIEGESEGLSFDKLFGAAVGALIRRTAQDAIKRKAGSN